ncbi:Prostaglandin E synthase 2 [Linum grandiflorum]
MRRVHGLTTYGRAIVAGSGFQAAVAAPPNPLFRSAMLSTSSGSGSQWPSRRLADYFGLSRTSVAAGVVGTMFFSVAASSMTQDVRAKELPKFIPKDLVLYQYEACPFCNKVKAFLDYYNIPYKVVEVNPISKKEIKWSEYKKVPILTVDGEQMVDSSEIVSELFKKIHPEGSNVEIEEETKWRKYGGWTVTWFMFCHQIFTEVHLRLSSHLTILLAMFHSLSAQLVTYISMLHSLGNFSFTERLVAKYAGATAMYFVAKKLKKKYNISDERAALYESAETWVDALQGRDYLGGSRPNLADLAVFGVLRPIRYLKSGKDMVEHTRIGEWYSRMEDAVGEPTRINA